MLARAGDALDRRRAVPVRVPILMYHKVGPVPHSEWWVPTAEFAAQVRALHCYGYETIGLDDLLRFRSGRATPPPKPIVLTFDDAYRDILTEVVPVLQQSGTGYRVTVFVPTGRVGGDNRWDEGIDFDREPPAPHLTWDEIRQVDATGCVDFQAHTITHPRLTELSPAELRRELVESRRTLERELQRPVRFFSYPFSVGVEHPLIRQAVRRAGYAAAVGASEVIEPDSRDRWNLRRLIIFSDTTVAHHPDRARRFLFGPALLNDDDVPRADCRGVAMSWRAAGNDGPLAIAIRGELASAVRGVRPVVELRAAGSSSILGRLGAGAAVVDLPAGPFSCVVDGALQREDGPLEARFALEDRFGCVEAFAGAWTAIGGPG